MSYSLFNLAGKKAIVTGGIKGIGKSMAGALLEAGVHVCILDILGTRFEYSSKNKIDDSMIHQIQVDLSNRKHLKKAFEEAVEYLGTIDILICNAGSQIRHKAEEFPLEDWDKVIEVNLTAVFELCQLAGKIMIKRGYGKIINTASMLSFIGGYTVPAYAASKGGIAQLTKTLSNEWASKGINVNAIAPGFIHTDLNTAIMQDKVRYNKLKDRIPMGRWGEPDDLKGVTIFLACSASDYINGVILPVDGGFLGSFS